MIKIGITGIIGSGKSTVSKIFETLGVPVYNADNNAKSLMISSDVIRKGLVNSFGNEVYKDGALNKVFLREKIFNSDKDRLTINSIVHPVVIKDFIKWSEQQPEQIVGIESALLYEAGIHGFIDYVVEVVSNVNTIVKRISIRDNISAEEALKRINIQLNSQTNKNIPTFVIQNYEDKSILEQTINIIKQLKCSNG